MPDWSEVTEANRLATQAHESLATYASQIEDGDRAANLDLTIALSVDALLYRLAAGTMRLAYDTERYLS